MEDGGFIMTGEVILGKNEYILRIENNKNVLEKINSIPGRKYDMNTRRWYIKINDFNTKLLKEIGFKIPFSVDNSKNKKDIYIEEDFGLMPFQVEGLKETIRRHGRILIADEMGLGKTVQALAYLRINPTLRPALIICPASLKINWKTEANKWCPDDKEIFVVDSKTDSLPKTGITIINYDMLKKFVRLVIKKEKSCNKKYFLLKKYNEIGYKILIIDEAHYIMNESSIRSIITLGIGRNIERIIALTGTPFLSRPKEIFNVANLLRPEIFDSKWRFAERYCDLTHDGYEWNYDGCNVENTKELHELLKSTIMIRRLKSEVLKDLPERRISVIPMEIENYDEYLAAEESVINNMGGNLNSFMVQCEYLKSLAMQGKFKQIILRIKEFLEITDEKLVIMAHHKEVIQKLCDEFKKIHVRYTGSETALEKYTAETKFQKDSSIRLFFGSIQAAKEGITLTAASKMDVIEFLWTPGVHDQVGDRIHRIGQTKPVNIYYPVADNTIEIKLAKMLDKKKKNITAMADGKEVSKNTLLMELYDDYKSRRS